MVSDDTRVDDGTLQQTEIGGRQMGPRIRRWLTIVGAVVLVIFLIYLLLILIYPSMNIGMSP